MKKSNGFLNRIIKNLMITVSLILAVFLGIREASQAGKKADFSKAEVLVKEGAGFGVSYIWRHQYPAVVWDEENSKSNSERKDESMGSALFHFFVSRSPLYRYSSDSKKGDIDYEEADPSYRGYIESGKFYEEHGFLLYDGGEESGEDGSVNAGSPSMKSGEANAKAGENTGTDQGNVTSSKGTVEANEPVKDHNKTVNKDDSLTCASSSVWPIVGTTYLKEQLADYDFMMKHFYSVHTSTTAGRDLMKANEFLSEDFTLKGGNDKPQILIYHTHSQEEYADHGPDKPDATVVGLGNYLTKLLTEKGYNVIHDTTVYDLQNGKLDRNKAYTYALDGITGILQKNPSIDVVLDVHRDGVNESLHMVNQVNGKPTAPLMFFNGVSQTPEGPIEYLANPFREKNLAFSFQMQLDAAAYFPNLTRKVYIKGLRYNQHLRARSALIEVGAQTNTYQEALNAMDPLAEVLDMVLQGN
jgi:stage II sporulation protein P